MNAPRERHDTPHSRNSMDGSATALLGRNPVLARLLGLARTYASVEDAIVASALTISAIMGFGGIILRFFLHVTIWELFPIQLYTFLFAVILGAATASRRGIHVRVEVLDTLLKSRPRRVTIIRAAMLGVALVCCILFTYLAFGFALWAWDIKQTDTVLTWFNLGIVKTLPLVMGLVSTVATGAYLVKAIRSLQCQPANSVQESK
jgi:TRAP-type C4-dicarboxylate transport system permease small subunit